MGSGINIYNDGSFDMVFGKTVIKKCFPGIDGHSIRAIKCIVEKKGNLNKITYEMLDGIVILHIWENGSDFSIKAELSGFKDMPHSFFPIYKAHVQEYSGIYRQGMGICGPSGYCSLQELENESGNISSYGIISLINTEDSLFFLTDDHNRFMSRFEISSSESEYTFGGRQKDITNTFSICFNLEKTLCEYIELPATMIYLSNSLQEGLTKGAETIATTMKARTHQEPMYHWCSWYYMYHNLSHEILKKYLQGFKEITPNIPLKYIQIDAGYFKSAGDWLIPNSLWPEGLKAAFDDILAAGYEPGIWIAPFMVGSRSDLFSKHQDWVLHGLDDKPLSMMKFYNEQKLWGYVDEDIYVLDTSHPEALKYIKNVFKTFHEWGATLFKTDFMFYGLIDSTKVKRFSPGRTSVEYLRELLEDIREIIGEDSYWLGCIAPFLPFIGYADGMRIAADVGSQWTDTEFGTSNVIREVIADNYFNNIYWQNDPDSVMLRDFHTYMNPVEIEALALFQAISGGAVYTSDPLHELTENRLNLFRFIKPSKKMRPRIPFLNQKRNEIVLVHKFELSDKYILFFFNPTKEEIVQCYKISDLAEEEKLFLHLWNSGEYDTKMHDNLLVRIPPHGCRLYFASNKNEITRDYDNLWL